MSKAIGLGCLVFLSFLPGSVFGATLPRYGMFDYADMCFSSVDGDWDGLRVVIMRFPENDVVYVETGEGGIGERRVNEAKVGRDGALSFDVSTFHFQGRMTDRALLGMLNGDKIHLPLRTGSERGGLNAHCAPRNRRPQK